MIGQHDITALILAGGRGSRMGGVDKGLQNFNGMPLALHVLTRLLMGGELGQIVISANRNLSAYEAFGVPVWPDAQAGFSGPLAGFLTGLEHAQTPYLLTVPCDAPLLPLDLVSRLAAALEAAHAEIAMVAAPERASDGQIQLWNQPVFCLLRCSLLESLLQFTRAGGHKIGAWVALHHTVQVPFDTPGDDLQAFANVNSLAQLTQLETP